MNIETARPRAIKIAILAMGGEGGGVLANWLVDVAECAGYIAQATSVPGVAQRTGATTYYVELFPEEVARRAGRDPVLATMAMPGDVDVVLASELMESGRAIQQGLVTSDRTTMIASTHRVYSMTERTAVGDGRVDPQPLIVAGKALAKRVVYADFARLAEESASVISAVLFGALAGADCLPFSRAQYEQAIRRGGVGVAASLSGFDAGFRAAIAPADAARDDPRTAEVAIAGPLSQPLLARAHREFPSAVHSVLETGLVRLADYQDPSYAASYLDRLVPLLQFDRSSGAGDFDLLREAARQLALWMSYEDAIRIADLKTRRARFDRVRQDRRVEPGELLQINEFLRPRVQEIADVLPAWLGRWILKTAWVRAVAERVMGGGSVVMTTSIRGFVQLRLVASMRRWRRWSLRFQTEQPRIDAWLQRLCELAPADYARALDVARAPRLLRGYGDTHARGTRDFDALLAASTQADLQR